MKGRAILYSIVAIVIIIAVQGFSFFSKDDVVVVPRKSIEKDTGREIESAFGAITNLIPTPCHIVTRNGYRVYRVCQYDKNGHYNATLPINNAHDYTSYASNIRIVFIRDDAKPIGNVSKKEIIHKFELSSGHDFFILKSKANDLLVNKEFVKTNDIIKNQYGICWHITRRQQEGRYLNIGLKHTREISSYVRSGLYLKSYLKRNDINLKETDVEWYDNIVKTLKTNNLNWLPTVAAFEGYKEKEITKSMIRNYGKWLALFAGHFKNDIIYWEVGNEMDLYQRNLGWSDNLVLDIYETAYKAIKKGNPNAKVMIGGLCIHNDTYIDMLLKKKGWNYFDILNFHAYPSSSNVEMHIVDKMTRLRKFSSRSGREMPIWFTEAGLSTYKASEDEQANVIGRSLLTSLALGVDKIFIYNLRDLSSATHEKERHFGLFNSELSKTKMAFKVYKTINALCPSGSTRPLLSKHKSLFIARWYDNEGRIVDAFWATGKDPIKVKFQNLEPNTEIFNYLGNRMKINSKETQIDNHIIYIRNCDNLKISEI